MALAACGADNSAGRAAQGDAGVQASSVACIGFCGEGGLALPDYGCSSDLRQAVPTDGGAPATCAPTEGCFEGACVPACQAAGMTGGNVGCDFLAATPVFLSLTTPQPIDPPCFAVFITNNWVTPAKVTVERGGSSYDVTKFGRVPAPGVDVSAWAPIGPDGIPVGQVGVLFLSNDPGSKYFTGDSLACPVPPAVNSATAVSGAGQGKAFHIVSDVPVSGYDILPFGGARSYLPSAQLLLPTTAWGTNYVAVVPPLGKDINTGFIAGPQWGQVVATEDNTTVMVRPTAFLNGGPGVAPAPQGATTSYTLAAGDYIQWDPTGEMSGTIVQSDKPVAVTGGNGYLCLQSATSPQGGGCDSGHQMIPPISALGSEYAATPYATRRADMKDESIAYRVVGAADGTVLTFDPPVTSAPSTLSLGQMTSFETTGPFRIASQDEDHPFYLAQMMSGAPVLDATTLGGSRSGASGPGSQPLGDEEFVNVLPPKQFLRSYVFFSDPTYATTNLVVTRAKSDAGEFEDVTIGCLGVVSGWAPVGTNGMYETTTVDLIRANQGVGKCSNGPQSATSDGPFGVEVWGLDRFASYAYPAGGLVRPINHVVVPLR